MSQYNLSEIMKRAHNLYKNSAKYPTFADAMRKSWKMAKFNVWLTEQRQVLEVEEKAAKAKEAARIEQSAIDAVIFNARLEANRIKYEEEAKAECMRAEIAARKEGISYNEYQSRISHAMGYGRGCYCGD